jgi:hypothetical protein
VGYSGIGPLPIWRHIADAFVKADEYREIGLWAVKKCAAYEDAALNRGVKNIGHV